MLHRHELVNPFEYYGLCLRVILCDVFFWNLYHFVSMPTHTFLIPTILSCNDLRWVHDFDNRVDGGFFFFFNLPSKVKTFGLFLC